MPDQTITASGTIGGVPITTTTTVPEYATDTVTFSHDISLGAQNSDAINIALAIDVSGSTTGSSGSDVDGDGTIDSYLTAQKLAAKELFQTYVDNGYDPSRVTVTLVSYAGSGQVVGVYNLDDLAAFNSAVDGLTPGGQTNFADPLADIYNSWATQGVDPNASNTVVFMSDGAVNTGGGFTDEAQDLIDDFGANISAIGVGANSSINQLNNMDNTAGAVKITDLTQLLAEINTPPPIVDVDNVVVEFSYEDPNNPGSIITTSHTYHVGDAELVPTANGYVINSETIDLVPDPPLGTNIEMKVTTYFNNGQDSISTGSIIVPAYICMSGFTMVMSDRGEVMAAEIRVGDMILTRDHGLQPVRWIGKRRIEAAQLRGQPRLRPIRIRAQALGPHNPQRDLVVSPQHRMLLSSDIAQRMFGSAEVLVAAKKLVGCEGIEIAQDLDSIEYVHCAFDQHELIFTDGALSESLYAGPQALHMLPPEQKEELLAIFPEWAEPDFEPISIRPIPKGAQQKQLIARHIKNHKPLSPAYDASGGGNVPQ